MALLLPDPCDRHCPQEFKKKARRILLGTYPRQSDWTAEIESDRGLRKNLLAFISDFSNWETAANQTHLDVSRALVKAAHSEEPPLVVDPFAGGGSIPLEAVRIGCDAFASDLNPVACLILKVMLEDIPRYGPTLADDLSRVGTEIKSKVKRQLADLYPTDPDGATPIAYLWARTVSCESPNCGIEIPLIRSFWLCKKVGRMRALRPLVTRPKTTAPSVEFELFEPRTQREVLGGTVLQGRAVCLNCGTVLQRERVQAQLVAQNGGADVVFDNATGRRSRGACITAVVTVRDGESGRHYRLPTQADYDAVRIAQSRATKAVAEWECAGKKGLCPFPDEALNPIRPSPNARGLSAVTRYGMSSFGDLFTARQKVSLAELVRLGVKKADPERTLIGLLNSRMADGNNSCSRWEAGAESPVNLFARQAIPLVWDFCESTPASNARGVFLSGIGAMKSVIVGSQSAANAQAQPADATDHPLPDESAGVWFTDPPYYDAIPYADLSDFFLVWLKRALPDHPLLRDRFNLDNPLSPKEQECVWNRAYDYECGKKDAAFFEMTISRAFKEGRRLLSPAGIGSVVFAHQSTEGWEAFLTGLVSAGWTVTGSWPIATEMASRIRARGNASLATSVHLVCRPRHADATIGDWADVLHELPRRVSDWMERLQLEGVRGADLVFACVGPALEIFSRYQAVETAEGRRIELAQYLEKVWEVVGRSALQQVLGKGEAQTGDGLRGALEQDARLSALFLWTYQSTDTSESVDRSDGDDEESVARLPSKGYSLPFDVVRRFAQPMGIDLDTWTGRIIGQAGGVVRLLPVAERTRQLFGDDTTGLAADWVESEPSVYAQQSLFPEFEAVPNKRTRHGVRMNIQGDDASLYAVTGTTLDRLHMAMLLQANGHASALRTLILTESIAGPTFCGSRMRYRLCTRGAAKKNGCLTRCYWWCPGSSMAIDPAQRSAWEASAGSSARSYADQALNHRVALVCPGHVEQWHSGRTDEEFECAAMRRFVSDVHVGGELLLRTDVSTIRAVGLIASEYRCLSPFDDFNGWDLFCCRDVPWSPLPEPHDIGEAVFGASPPQVSRVRAAGVVSYVYRFVRSPPTDSQARTLRSPPVEEAPLMALPRESQEAVAQAHDLSAHYWESESFGEHPTGDELGARYVVLLLRALGLRVELIALTWQHIDVSVFSKLPRTSTHCHHLTEVNRLCEGVEGTLDQPVGFVVALAVPCDVIDTYGIRCPKYGSLEDVAPIAYANLACLKESSLEPIECLRRP